MERKKADGSHPPLASSSSPIRTASSSAVWGGFKPTGCVMAVIWTITRRSLVPIFLEPDGALIKRILREEFRLRFGRQKSHIANGHVGLEARNRLRLTRS